MSDPNSPLASIAASVSKYVAHATKKPDEKPKPGWWAQQFTQFIDGIPKIVGIGIVIILLYVGASRIADNLVHAPNDQNLPLAASRFGPITASSYRQNSNTPGAQPASALLDDNPATSWLECAGGTPVNETRRMQRRTCNNVTGAKLLGVDEYITLPLTEPTDIKTISIRNGRQANQREFYRNGRVKELKVDIWSEGSPNSESFTKSLPLKVLADEMGYQSFPTDCSSGSWFSNVPRCEEVTQIRLTITTIYPGENQPKPKTLEDPSIVYSASSDTGLSDLQVIPVDVAIPFTDLAKPLTG